MNKKRILCGIIVASTANNMQAESRPPIEQVLPYLNENKEFFTRGFFTGLFSAGVKSSMPEKALSFEGMLSKNQEEKPNQDVSKKAGLKQRLISSGKSAIETFPKKLVSNSLATIGVAKMHADNRARCIQTISSFPIPLLSQGFAMAMVKDRDMPDAAKMATGYAAFWGAKAIQCGCPVKTAFAVSAFATGAAIYKKCQKNVDIDPVSALYDASVASNYYKRKDEDRPKKNETFLQRINDRGATQRA